jgi:hypothetical protein
MMSAEPESLGGEAKHYHRVAAALQQKSTAGEYLANDKKRDAGPPHYVRSIG